MSLRTPHYKPKKKKKNELEELCKKKKKKSEFRKLTRELYGPFRRASRTRLERKEDRKFRGCFRGLMYTLMRVLRSKSIC
jgi:hypothetical protein